MIIMSRASWYVPAILAFERLRQEDYEEFEDSLGYMANSKPARDL